MLGIKLNKLWPAFLDRYLVGRSFGRTNELCDPNQPDNLFEPAPGEWAAHGPFDRESQERSLQMALSRRRAAVSLLGVGFGGLLAALWLRRRALETSI